MVKIADSPIETFAITTMLNKVEIFILSLWLKHTIHSNHLEVLSAYAGTYCFKNDINESFNRVTWPWQGLVMELTFYTEQWKYYIVDLNICSGMSYKSVCSFVLPFNSLLDNTCVIK